MRKPVHTAPRKPAVTQKPAPKKDTTHTPPATPGGNSGAGTQKSTGRGNDSAGI